MKNETYLRKYNNHNPFRIDVRVINRLNLDGLDIRWGGCDRYNLPKTRANILVSKHIFIRNISPIYLFEKKVFVILAAVEEKN